MMQNPYEPGEIAGAEKCVDSRAMPRFLFFVINLGSAVLMLILCVVAIFASGAAQDAMGGVVLAFPLISYVICEWVCWYHKRPSLERVLGGLNIGCGGILLFGLVTNIGEVLIEDGPKPIGALVGFSIVIGSLAAYSLTSGYLRWKWNGSIVAAS